MSLPGSREILIESDAFGYIRLVCTPWNLLKRLLGVLIEDAFCVLVSPGSRKFCPNLDDQRNMQLIEVLMLQVLSAVLVFCTIGLTLSQSPAKAPAAAVVSEADVLTL